MTDKPDETARLLALGLLAVLAVVGMLLGNDKASGVFTAVMPLLAYFLGGPKPRP